MITSEEREKEVGAAAAAAPIISPEAGFDMMMAPKIAVIEWLRTASDDDDASSDLANSRCSQKFCVCGGGGGR